MQNTGNKMKSNNYFFNFWKKFYKILLKVLFLKIYNKRDDDKFI